MTNNGLDPYCAPGVQTIEQWLNASDGVQLRVIHFEQARHKNRPVILFIAGWVSMLEAWSDVLPELNRHHNVFYVETREKISSRISGLHRFGVEDIGQDIVHIINRLQLQENQYVIFASSLGATAVLDCFQHMSHKPACLILVGPNAVFRIPGYWYLIVKNFYPPLYNLLKPAVKFYLRHFRLNMKSDAAQFYKYSRSIDAADPYKLKNAVLALSSYAVWDRLDAVDVPTLIIGASEDKLHEPENLKKMVQLLSRAEYIDLHTNQRTHSLEMVDHMKKFIQKIYSQE